MAYDTHVELPTAEGPAFFNPDRVVFVAPQGDHAVLVLETNVRVGVSLTAHDAALRLWSYTNTVNEETYFNEKHVIALVPTADGCQLLFSQGGDVTMKAPPELIIEGLRAANEQRAAFKAQS